MSTRYCDRMHDHTTTWLIPDVGGTKTRVSLWHANQDVRDLRRFVEYRNVEFDSLDALLAKYLNESAPETPTRAVLAIAGPIRGSPIRLLNIDWAFETEALARELGLTTIDVIMTFTRKRLPCRRWKTRTVFSLAMGRRSHANHWPCSAPAPVSGSPA